MRAVLGVYYAVVLASENDNNFEEARWPIFFLRFGARLRCGLTCNWFNDGRTRTITAAGYVRSFDRTTFCDVATFVKCDVRVRFSKAPSISATVSKQRCRILHCRMLLRHCCRFGNNFERNFVLSTKWKHIEHVQFVSTTSKGRNFAILVRNCCRLWQQSNVASTLLLVWTGLKFVIRHISGQEKVRLHRTRCVALRCGMLRRFCRNATHPVWTKLNAVGRTVNEYRPKCGDALRLGVKAGCLNLFVD